MTLRFKSCSGKSRFFGLRKSKSIQRGRGFALIVTLSLMMLLALVALGLLSLASISQRAGGNADMATARANARLALQLAIGELQRYAGPDQRVTGESQMIYNDADLPVGQRNWTGVWRTDMLKNETNPAFMPLIARDPSKAGLATKEKDSLVDRRADGSYNRANEVLTWLVSGAQPGQTLDPSMAIPSADRIELFGTSVVNQYTVPDADKIAVGLVPVTREGRRAGSYAWWVRDESTKARFDLPIPTAAAAEDYFAEAPPRVGIGTIGKDPSGQGTQPFVDYISPAKENQIKNAMSHSTIDLVSPDMKSNRRKHYHDIGVGSIGILADSLNGGLKRDLGRILHAKGAPGINNDPKRKPIAAGTPILSAAAMEFSGPKWGTLFDWASYSENLASNSPDTAVSGIGNYRADAMITFGNDAGTTVENSPQGPSIAGVPGKAQIAPVVVDASIGYGCSFEGPGPYNVRLHLVPVVVLWNPYNVKLESRDYVISIANPVSSVFFSRAGSSDPPVGPDLTPTNASANRPTNPCFTMSSVAFEPGECILFGADGVQPWGGSAAFPLVSNAPSIPKGSFYWTAWANKIPAASPPVPNPSFNYNLQIAFNGYWKRVWSKFGIGADLASMEPLQFTAYGENGVRPSNIPSYQFSGGAYAEPLVKSDDPNWIPYSRWKWGLRMMWLDETAANKVQYGTTPVYLDRNHFTDSNLRGAWNFRAPVETTTRIQFGGTAGAGNPFNRVLNGPFLDDPFRWDWAASGGSLVNGKTRVSPFGPGGGALYPMFDIPTKKTPLLSIGALQHAPMSLFRWHPSYAVGNSLADSRVPRKFTTNHVTKAVWDKFSNNYASANNVKNWASLRQDSAGMDGQNYLFDLSYELNYALWDRFFISSLPATPSFDPAIPLPNSRIIPTAPLDSPTVRNDLVNAERAASKLAIAGAFNVNSTSVEAWRALLASAENAALNLKKSDGSRVAASSAYPRLIRPVGEAYDPSDPMSPEAWTGFRVLDDKELYELATEIVAEVKQRGPFLSLSDFVNRRLVQPPTAMNFSSETDFTKTGLAGTLQAAIERTEINKTFRELGLYKTVYRETEYIANPGSPYGQQQNTPNYPSVVYDTQPVASGSRADNGVKQDNHHLPESKLTGMPTWLMQADVLQRLGSTLTARGDTFTIRTYGEARDPAGNVTARAWVEAVVQRTAEPIEADVVTGGLDPVSTPTSDLGRRFVITSFRWLSPSEI